MDWFGLSGAYLISGGAVLLIAIPLLLLLLKEPSTPAQSQKRLDFDGKPMRDDRTILKHIDKVRNAVVMTGLKCAALCHKRCNGQQTV